MSKVKEVIRRVLHQFPYIGRMARELKEYKGNSYVPPGHFYSPVISLPEIMNREAEIFNQEVQTLAGINLNGEEQFNLLTEFKQYYSQLPFKQSIEPSHRYYYENKYFTYADAVFLYSLVRKFKPQRIVEIGSGFSSAALLDINDLFFEKRIRLTFIEPFPINRLAKLLRANDDYVLVEKFLQDVELGYFEQLQENDILFIDSSHVVKTGSEVNYLLFEVLPSLKPGVLIHFHDIFYPFECPKEWILEKRSWNETYFIRAFLMHNSHYQIITFNSYLQQFHRPWLEANMPFCLKDKGSGLWLMKR